MLLILIWTGIGITACLKASSYVIKVPTKATEITQFDSICNLLREIDITIPDCTWEFEWKTQYYLRIQVAINIWLDVHHYLK